MTGLIEIPVWLLVILILLAIVTTLQYFLLAPVRMLMRRRANRVIDEVNNRLALQLPSFKLTKRQVLIDRLVYHPHVMQVVDQVALEENTSRDAVLQQVRGYASEIVPAFNAWVYFKWAYWIARRLVHMLYRVRLGFADDKALSDLPANSSVVFVMNHRSNMDYIVATYLAAERTALSYAVGEWARVWPLQQLIRSMGGYFVRRDSGDALYRQVLKCYVQMAAEGGVPQAVFPEGKLSRDGKLGKPKLGLLGYLVQPFMTEQLPAQPHSPSQSTLQAAPADNSAEVLAAGLSKEAPDNNLVFIPVGINYDRVLEDRTLLATLDPARPRHGTFFTLRRFAGFIVKQCWLALTGRWYRFGYACVNFGTPLSLQEWTDKRELTVGRKPWHQEVEALADELMERIGQIIPILPVAMVASVFQQHQQQQNRQSQNQPDLQKNNIGSVRHVASTPAAAAGLSELDVKIRVAQLMETLSATGAHIYIPRSNIDYAVTVGIRMLVLRHALVDNNGLYRVNEKDSDLIDFYSASIEHLLIGNDQ